MTESDERIGIGLWAEKHDDLRFTIAGLDDVNGLLALRHYLGPKRAGSVVLVVAGILRGEVVAAQVWGLPLSRRLPADGTWWELSRWCLTSEAGKNAGSKQHAWVRRWINRNHPNVTTLISYSDPMAGHTGSLYRACNWEWKPTWHSLRAPGSRAASWHGAQAQTVKDRWVFALQPDARRDELLKLAYGLTLPDRTQAA